MVGEGEMTGRVDRRLHLVALDAGWAGPWPGGRGTRTVVVIVIQPSVDRFRDIVQLSLRNKMHTA